MYSALETIHISTRKGKPLPSYKRKKRSTAWQGSILFGRIILIVTHNNCLNICFIYMTYNQDKFQDWASFTAELLLLAPPSFQPSVSVRHTAMMKHICMPIVALSIVRVHCLWMRKYMPHCCWTYFWASGPSHKLVCRLSPQVWEEPPHLQNTFDRNSGRLHEETLCLQWQLLWPSLSFFFRGKMGLAAKHKYMARLTNKLKTIDNQAEFLFSNRDFPKRKLKDNSQ